MTREEIEREIDLKVKKLRGWRWNYVGPDALFEAEDDAAALEGLFEDLIDFDD